VHIFSFAACGGKRGKKSFSGTPRTPAKDCVLSTPGLVDIPHVPAKDCVLCTAVYLGGAPYAQVFSLEPRQRTSSSALLVLEVER